MSKITKENVFFSHEDLWCCRTRVVNFKIQAIELHICKGFFTRDEAERAFEKASHLFSKEFTKLKDTCQCPFTFCEYLKHWFTGTYHTEDSNGSTKVKHHWIVYNIIFPQVKADPILSNIDVEYIENLIESCKTYCASAEFAVYKLLCSIISSAHKEGFIENILISDLTVRKEPKSNVCIYTKEQLKIFLNAVYEDPCSHRLEVLLALFCGLRPGEILGLTYNNFDSCTKILNIHKQYTKNGYLPSENRTLKYSYKELEGERHRSFIVPDLICEELILRKEKNRCFFLAHPAKTDECNFCISSRGKVKTLETLNTRLKYITENTGLPTITMYDLRDMFVWILLERGCSWDDIKAITGGVEIERILES